MRVLLVLLLGAATLQELRFPRADRPLVFEDGDTVADLIEAYGRETDQVVTYDRRVIELARRASLGGVVTIGTRNVHSTVEAILARHGFVLAVEHAEAPRILGMYAADSPRSGPRTLGPRVSVDELAGLAEHEALVVHTVVTLDAARVLDVRSEPGVVPLASSPCVLVYGPAAKVAERVGVLMR